jgi:N-acetylglucosaminyldiphosphoundecaprenol N-acetyl-beta-D-mannosaminyltransferase
MNLRTIEFLGASMHAMSMQQTIAEIDKRISQHTFTQHVVINVAKLISMRSDSKLYNSVQSCDIINIDGMGVVWGARMLGHDIPERVAGVDLFMELVQLSAHKSYPIFLLGATDDVVSSTRSTLEAQYPSLQIAGHHNGYFWDDEAAVVQKIRNSGARLLFVAISSPQKENFIERWKHELGVDFVMGVGGTFDVVAGKVKRAPVWVQHAGMEWLFRLLQEPRRMWRRYLTTNLAFAQLMLAEKFKPRVVVRATPPPTSRAESKAVT